MRFADLTHRGGPHLPGAEARTDLWHAGVWKAGPDADWSDRTARQRLVDAGLSRPNMAMKQWTAQGAGASLLLPGRYPELATLAVIASWRTATVDQVAAITGYRISRTMLDLMWASTLVSRGRLRADGAVGLPDLLRPTQSADFDGLLGHRLPYVDWLGVTGGTRWVFGAQADRHNILAVELALRVAEYTPIPCVLGETWARLTRVFPDQSGIPPTAPWAGDAVFVRGDGLRIVVELTLTSSDKFADRCERWASLLARDTSRSVAVLFVEARHPDHRGRADRRVLPTMRGRIARAANGGMDRVAADVPKRMALASWTDWFPALGECSDRFLHLDVECPTGPATGRWEAANRLDPFDVPGPGLSDVPVIANSRLLYATPHWLRSGPHPDPVGIVAAHSGITTIPHAVRPVRTAATRNATRALVRTDRRTR